MSKKFEQVLLANQRKVYNYLLKLVNNRDDAQDLLQNVFLSFYEKMDKVNSHAYEAYLFKTAYHQALNYLRKRKNNPVFTVEDTSVFNESIVYSDNENEIQERKNKLVLDALAQLPPNMVEVIELQYYQKKSYKQIAEFLHTSVPAVDSLLVRAKKKLKKIISQENDATDVFMDKEDKEVE